MRTLLSLTVVVLFSAVNLHAACGVERWSVKTGTDPQASSVALGSYVSSTIYNFHQSARPGSLPSNGRVAPRETTQYQVGATLIKYVRENDSDYHLVIKDSAGRTMIVELPASNCVGAGSPFGPGIVKARQQFDARFTATTSMKTTSTPVTVKGVGFWDFLHGQTGVAPNGIEIHPVLNISIGTAALGSDIFLEAEEPAVKLPADMIRDDDGGIVRVFRGGEAVTGEILFHGGPVLEDPSIHMLYAGAWRDEEMRPITANTRRIDWEPGVRELDRYGVRTFGFRVDARKLGLSGDEITDLDVQRALQNEVDAGRIQHVDENAVYVIVLDPSMRASVGNSTDWLSYHSQFHPTELPMRYVVVRGGLDREQQRAAISASVSRALINPAGDGWY